jgi:TonB-linked SusC/RagA family outer membrane protein
MGALLVLASAGMAFAQVTVTGTVRDSQGPMLGVSVIVEGSTTGITTGVDGKFSIRVPNAQSTLVFKFVGMDDVVYPLEGRTSDIDVLMSESASQIDDIVVIGYGAVRRGSVTGSVSSVTAKTIASVPVPSAAQAIQGRMAGVQVTSNDGSPDAEILIRVRGGTSISGDNSPLYIVDGFQVSNINNIPTSDIERIDVLKDAATTAIYGARGANGVVIISTKSARGGRTDVSFNAYWQFRSMAKNLDVMDPYEYVMLNYEIEALKGDSQRNSFIKKYGAPGDYYIYKGQKGRDWQDELFGKTTMAQNYDLSVSGGSDKTRFKLSLNYVDDQGIQYGSSTQRTNLNFRLNHEIVKNLTLEFNSRINYKVNNGGNIGPITGLTYRPVAGLSDYSFVPPGDDFEEEERTPLTSPTTTADQNYNKQSNYTFTNTAALNWTIMKGLIFRSEFGLDLAFSERDRWYGPESGTARNGNNSRPLTDIDRGRTPQYRLANTLTYMFDIKKDHQFNVLAGQEIISRRTFATAMRTTDFPVDITPEKALANLSLGKPNSTTSSIGVYDRTASFFGRVSYNYKQKYLLDVTLRADGSSKFAPGNRWGYFPAASVAWRIDKENFMANVRAVSSMKLRVSLGTAGNNRITDDLWRRQYSVSSSKPIAFGDVDQPAYTPASTRLVNPDIKWETTSTRNVGLDVGLFKERLSIVLDGYWNTTRDLLYEVSIPAYLGYSNMQANMAQTSNKGFEVTFNGSIIQNREFFLDANFNIGWNKNRIDKLGPNETRRFLASGWASTDLMAREDYLLELGKTMGLIYGYETDGFYSIDDFDFNPVAKTWALKEGVPNSSGITGSNMPGTLKFKKLIMTKEDENVKNPEISLENDRTIIGNTNPKFSGGFGLNAAWKGFDAAVFFTYMYGFDVYNANKIRATTRWTSTDINMLSIVDSKNRFRYFDDLGTDLRSDPDALRELNKDANIWTPASLWRPIIHSWAIEDGSFLRLSTATLGYTLPSNLTNKVGIRTLRMYVTGYNLFCLTNYSGYDPEVNIQSGLTPGRDYSVYPRNRNITVGLNLTF